MVWWLWVGCRSPEVEPIPGSEVSFLEIWGSYNTDRVSTIDLLDDGGAVVGLELASPARTDAVIKRLSADGIEAWELRWGREFDEELHASQITSGKIRIAGGIWEQDITFADTRTLLLDVDLQSGALSGNPTWEWNPTGARDVVWALLASPQRGEGSIAVGESGEDLLLVKLDRAGVPTDDVLFDGGEVERGLGAALAADAVIAVGQSTDESDQEDHGDLWVAAFEAGDLSERWSLEWGEAFQSEEIGNAVASDGTTIVVVGADALGQGVILGLDLQGALLWERLWDSGGRDSGRAVAFDPDGLAVVAMDAGTDLALLWIDPTTGGIVEEIRWGGPEDETITALAIDDDQLCIAGTITGGPDGAEQALAACGPRDPLALPEAPQEAP